MINFLITEGDFKCAGCGKTERGFCRSDKLPIILMDYTKMGQGEVFENHFHNLECARKFLNSKKLLEVTA